MTAFVRDVHAAAAARGSRLKLAGSMSARTGRAPSRAIAPAVAKNENGVLSPSFTAPHPARHERDQERVGARRDADDVRGARGLGELALERFHVGTHDEVAGVDDA